ncbi:MAG TPA: hypothetical protein VLR94_07875 [Acidobacteriota bacterium]|nr:hypothetical protein [Acidobacteriota bacterium]
MGNPVGSATVRTGQVNNSSNIQAADANSAAAKPAESQSAQEPVAQRASDPSGKVAEHQLDGQLSKVMAERELNPVSPNTTVDITNKEMRNQLLRSCPQTNPISTAAGNAPHICGAAATANALVLSSKTTEQAKANAQAVRDLARNAPSGGVKLSAGEDASLKKMEAGKMSPTDVQHLQQVLYRIGGKMPNGGMNMSDGGLSTVQMGAMTTMLAKRGAFEGSSVTMHCNSQTGKNGTFDHWTTTVDGIHANSQVINERDKTEKSAVQGGPPAALARGTDKWQGELWLSPNNKPAELHAQIRGDGDTGKEHRALTIDTSKYDVDTLAELDFQFRTNTRKVSE